MIYDSLENIHLYKNLPDSLFKALEYAAKVDSTQAEGAYEIAGKDMYAMVSSYKTYSPTETKFEGHRKYIDLQVLIEGCECLHFTATEGLSVREPYSDEKDLVFFEDPPSYSTVILKPSLFVILFPHEAHQPCCHFREQSQVRKLVVKVKATAHQ